MPLTRSAQVREILTQWSGTERTRDDDGIRWCRYASAAETIDRLVALIEDDSLLRQAIARIESLTSVGCPREAMDEAAALMREGSQDAIATVCIDRNAARARVRELESRLDEIEGDEQDDFDYVENRT